MICKRTEESLKIKTKRLVKGVCVKDARRTKNLETRRIENYLFVNDTRSDRYGFTHITHLLDADSGNEIATGKARWINRTWEYYRYQSSMMNAVRSVISSLEGRIKDRFMSSNGYQKLTKARKEELEALYDQDADIQEYRRLYKALEYR